MSSIIRSLAVSVLSRYLGEYVVGLDSEHLDISISSGDACLEHLELRASALDSMDLPITVRAGFLEKVKINIPWTSIRSQPASIEISGLYLLAGPRKDTEFDMEAEMRRAQSDKQKRLLVAEMLRGRGGSDDTTAGAAASKKDDGLTGRLIALVLNNLQVRVKHVHMRYEDDRTTPARPFVCGITLESFSGVTVDESGAPAFVVDPKGFIQKLVELRNFAVYWDSQGRHLEFSTGQEMRAAMDALIWKEDQVHEPSLSYLLLPVSGKLQLAMLRDSVVTDFDKPQLLLEFVFENIRVMLHESQYKDFAALAEGFRLQSLRAPYVSLQRPAERPTSDARGWWNYTLRCVQQDLREERARWSWERILQRKQDRVRYIVLYCQLKRSGPTAVQPPELVELEERLSYEDILMYRSLCEALLRRESASGGAVLSSPSGSPTKGGAEASGEAKPGYLGWMIGWAYASAPSEAALGEGGNDNNAAADNVPDSGGGRQVSASERLLTSKFMNELYAAVDDDKRGRGAATSDASVVPVPEEYVRRKVVFSLGQGSVTLVEANSQLLSTMVFSQLSCGLDSRTERHTFSAALNSMQLFHGRVPIIASPLNAPNPIWTGTFEMGASPASAAVGKHDFSIKLHVQPLSLLFSRPFTEGLVHFFVRRRGHAWRDIQDFTGATAQIDALQRQAANQLREVIENRRSVYIAIQVDAPRIFVPEDVAKPLCSVLTVQMESLTIGTVVRERLAPNLVTQELVQQNSDLFYDEYTLSVARVQLALVKPIGEWRWDAFAECCGPEVPLIDPCALEFSLQHCLVDVPYLPTIKLATALPNVRAFLSAKQFLSFVTCLRTVVSEDVDDLAVDPALVSQAVMVPFGDEEILSLADPRGSEQWIVDKERARKLQVSFRIERASVVLHHGKTDRNVAVLSFVDFNISVAKLPKEMHFAIFLHQLELVDLTKPPDSPARFLMRSVELPGVGGASNHLVTVRFVGIHRDASSYEGVDYDVDMHMMEMDCVCNRDTVANLIDLGNDILDGLAATAPAQAIERKAAASAVPPVDVAGLFLKVRFRMDSLRIQFALEGGAAFAEAHIAQWDQVMRFRNDDTWSLDIRVGTTVLTDLRHVATRWAKVLQLTGGETLHFTFETFSAASASATERLLNCHPGHLSRGHNMLLTLRVNAMRYVYVQNFVTEWVRYFVEIHSMQQMVAASYARAAGLAVNTVVSEQLFCFSVELRNPLIVVPRSYESEGFTLLDLGTVQVQNLYCRDLKGVLFGRTEYTMDKMHIALSPQGAAHERAGAKLIGDFSVELAKEELEDADQVNAETPITRWTMHCSPVMVVLSERQAEFLFATVRENLVADAQKEETRSAYKDYQFTPYILAAEEAGAASGGEGKRSSIRRQSLKVPEPVVIAERAPVVAANELYIVRKIDLELERIEIHLEQGDGRTFDKRQASMMNFDIANLAVRMSTDSSGYSLSEYDMESVNLHDVRYSQTNKFPRVLSSNKNSACKQELHLTQVNYANGDKEFMLTVENPRIVLTPWAYRELWSFVWPLFEAALASWDLWASDGEVKVAPVLPPSDWTFRVTVTDPEIVLVTDASLTASEALVLKGPVLFKHYEPASGGQMRSIHFRQLEAFRTFLTDQNDSVSGNHSTVNMVEPTDITVFHEWMPHKMREKWSVEIEPMNFTVSYHDFRMLAKLYRYWWPKLQETEEMVIEPLLADVLVVDGQQVEAATSDEPVAAAAAVEPDRPDAPAAPPLEPVDSTALQAIYKLSTQGTLLRLVNDFYAGNVPVALVSLPSVVVRVSQTSDTLKLFASVSILAEVYNDEAQAWEPVIEPFTAEVAYSWTEAAGIRASVTAESVLDVNLTEAATDMLLRTWRDLSADFYSPETVPSVASETFRVLGALYMVRNDTGTPVWVWRVDEESAVVEAPIHGYEVPLPEAAKLRQQPLLYQSLYRNLDKRLPASVCIKVAGDLRIARDYPIHEVGCHILRVDPEDKIKLVLQISNQKGGKLLQVRTNVRFCNATDTALELEGHSSHVGSIALTVMQPGSVFALPLAFLRNGRVRVRPVGRLFGWSGQSVHIPSIKRNSALMLCPPADKNDKRADFALLCVMDPQVEDPGAMLVPPEDEHVVTFCAPVLVENLLGVPCNFRLIKADTTNKVVMQSHLEKGDVARVNLDVRQRLALSVRLQDYNWSAPRGVLGVRAANSLELLDATGLPLTLDLHYVKFASGLTKISIFTQFWIVNATALPLVHSQYFMQSRIVVAGQTSTIMVVQAEEAPLQQVPRPQQQREGGDLLPEVPVSMDAIELPSPKGKAEDTGSSSPLPSPLSSARPPVFAEKQYAPDLFRPLMYYPEKAGKKMSMRSVFTHWSEPFSVGAAGTWEVVDLLQVKRRGGGGAKTRGLLQFVVSVEREPGKFWRTRTVTVKPRMVLVNHTKAVLLCAQHGDTRHELTLKVDEQVPYHWTSAKREKLLCVCFAENGWNWSAGFPLTPNHKTTIKARNLRGQSALLKVRVLESEQTLLVVFDEEHPEFPTYRIHNASSEPVLIHQYLAVPHIYETVPAGASVAYAWDDPRIKPLLLEVVSARNEEKILLDLDNLGLFNTSDPMDMLRLSPLEGLGHFYGVVTAEGPSKVATIKLNNNSQPIPHLVAKSSKRKQKFTAHLSLRGIGVSVVNRVPVELVYVSMSDIMIDYEDNKREQTFDFSIGHLQVDNQGFLTQFPVLLWTRPKREKFLTLSLVRSADYASVHYIKRLGLFVEDMDVCMDDSVFLKMWDFVANVARSFGETGGMADPTQPATAEQTPVPGPSRFVIPTHNLKTRQIYLQELTLSGTNLMVSFINTDDTADGQLGETAVSRIIRTYGALANIERAPVKLEPLTLTLQFLSRQDLMDTLKAHYVTGMRRGLAKILASADFLGAPMALASHVREGARDLMEMPRKGAQEDGTFGAIAGVGKGTASLAKSVGYGAFNSVHKITGKIGDGVSALALDENYERERAKLARNRPEHVGEGLAYGARDLGLGIFRGISGVVLEPVRGAREDGVRGFFTGISRGITGLYVKPFVGAVDLVTRSAEGLKNTTTYWEEGSKRRVRLPRFIGAEGVMHVFQKHKAEGQWILYTLSSGKYFVERREFYKAHFSIGVKTTLIVTDAGIIQTTDEKEDFYISISAIERITIDRKVYADGIIVIFNKPDNGGAAPTPRKICCVFNNQNFAHELIKLLTALLRHEVESIGRPHQSPKANRRRSLGQVKYDQFLSSEDEAPAVLEESAPSRGGGPAGANSNND